MKKVGRPVVNGYYSAPMLHLPTTVILYLHTMHGHMIFATLYEWYAQQYRIIRPTYLVSVSVRHFAVMLVNIEHCLCSSS